MIVAKTMIEFLLLLLFLCLATCITELIVLMFFKDRKHLYKSVLIVNVITNPILNMIYPSIYYFMYWSTNNFIFSYIVGLFALILMEIGVVFMETWMYGFLTDLPLSRRRNISISLNAVSFSLGIFVQVFFDILLFF